MREHLRVAGPESTPARYNAPMKFRIIGAERQTGDDVNLIVEEQDRASAERYAYRAGVLVERIEPVEPMKPLGPLGLLYGSPPQPQFGRVKQARKVWSRLPLAPRVNLVVGLGIAMMFIFHWTYTSCIREAPRATTAARPRPQTKDWPSLIPESKSRGLGRSLAEVKTYLLTRENGWQWSLPEHLNPPFQEWITCSGKHSSVPLLTVVVSGPCDDLADASVVLGFPEGSSDAVVLEKLIYAAVILNHFKPLTWHDTVIAEWIGTQIRSDWAANSNARTLEQDSISLHLGGIGVDDGVMVVVGLEAI